MAILGYIGACLAGMSLGLIGGGGSIMVVPVLVYLLAVTPVEATAYSLFVVGVASLIGASTYAKVREIDYKMALVFAVPSFVGVSVSRRILMPHIPDTVFQLGNLMLTKSVLVMFAFATVMLMASTAMIRRGRAAPQKEATATVFRPASMIFKGFGVGLVTGFVGAGGGFLIIPALVILGGLPMKRAVGTSLLIIAVNSLIGFAGDVGSGMHIDWSFLTSVSGATVAGILFGTYSARHIPGKKLEPVFGWFVLVMGAYILVRQVVSLIA